MAISVDDLNVIEQHLDNRYVKQSDCNDTQAEMNEKIAKQRTRLELATHDLSAIKKGIWLVATASIGSLITALFELLTR